jgi:hypothetical protein
MASRSLRSRTLEAHEENQDLPAGERDTGTPTDELLVLGSAGESSELCGIQASPADVGPASQASEAMVKQSEQTLPESVDNPTKLQQMLQGFFERIKSELSSNQAMFFSISGQGAARPSVEPNKVASDQT